MDAPSALEGWQSVGKRKLAVLIRREDFAAVESIDGDSAVLRFTAKTCRVSGYGEVVWVEQSLES